MAFLLALPADATTLRPPYRWEGECVKVELAMT